MKLVAQNKKKKKRIYYWIRSLSSVKKKCLSSSHKTGLAIAVYYTNSVIGVSRAGEVFLQLLETHWRAISDHLVQADGFVAEKQ